VSEAAIRATPARPRAAGAILAIALNTFREAIRDRVLYLLLVFALVMIGTARLLSLLTVGSETKIIKDLGLSAISLFGMLTAVFVGVSLVSKEIEKRTIYTLLANPVRRWQFVTGKYCGLLAVLAMNVVLMAVALGVVLWFRGDGVAGLLPAILLTWFELALVTAFAILLSCFTNPILAALGTFAVYVVGHLSWSLPMLGARLPEGFGRTVCDVLYVVLPNLDRLNVRADAVHGLPLEPGYVGMAVIYGTLYSVAVLVLACLVFERKEFN
jgi:ABC-type transport system involved in multi-copper enzyme maturation permease subunit